MFNDLLALSSEKKYRPFFLGARNDTLLQMIKKIKSKYPNLEIAGSHHGYFLDEDEVNIVNEIKTSEADLLFLGITSPKKEQFIDKYFDEMKVPFVMGVGGTFDIYSGKTKRAPKWIQDAGVEWLYRISQEPKRLWKRYARTNTIFIYMVLKEKFKRL